MKGFVLTTLLFFSILFPFFVSMAELGAGKVPEATDLVGQGSPITEPNQFLGIIASIVKYTYAIFFIAAVAFILFAAFNYLTGGDEPEKIKTAHQQIMYAAIAIAVALLAVGTSLIVKRFLQTEGGGGTQASSPIAPTQTIQQPQEKYNVPISNYDFKQDSLNLPQPSLYPGRQDNPPGVNMPR